MTEINLTKSRMVDYIFGLRLSNREMDVIHTAYKTLYNYKRSLNQTSNYEKTSLCSRIPMEEVIWISDYSAGSASGRLGQWSGQ